MLNSWSQLDVKSIFKKFIQSIFQSYDRQQMEKRKEWRKGISSLSLSDQERNIQQWQGNAQLSILFNSVTIQETTYDLIHSSLCLWTMFKIR